MTSYSKPPNKLRRARPLLGTLVDIAVTGASHRLPAAIEAAFAAIARVHQLMSFHAPDSDVSWLNRQAHQGVVHVDPQTWNVLARAQAFSEASDGAFDVTVAPRLVDWGYLPGAAMSSPVLQDGYRRIELRAENGVWFQEPVLIDLGGIAKGYAVDCACAALESHGVFDYIVNAGGDLRVGRSTEMIHVRHPRWPTVTVPLATIAGAAVATSAPYFTEVRGANGNLHPIIAPATGAPTEVGDSVTVIASECLTADALTKVVSVLGPQATAVLRQFGAQACVLSKSGERCFLAACPEQRPVFCGDHDHATAS